MGRLENVEKTLVGTNLELLTRLLVDVRAAEDRVARDVGGERDRPSDAGARALRGLDDVVGRLVEELMVERLEANTNLGGGGHNFLVPYSMTLVTMPAPTVRPPSRIAKRICSSRPTGVIISIVMVMLSPGMTIFVPSGSAQVPVTSVVRM